MPRGEVNVVLRRNHIRRAAADGQMIDNAMYRPKTDRAFVRVSHGTVFANGLNARCRCTLHPQSDGAARIYWEVGIGRTVCIDLPRHKATESIGVTAILGAGFDPGVVDAYVALAAQECSIRWTPSISSTSNAGSYGGISQPIQCRNNPARICRRLGMAAWQWFANAMIEVRRTDLIYNTGNHADCFGAVGQSPNSRRSSGRSGFARAKSE